MKIPIPAVMRWLCLSPNVVDEQNLPTQPANLPTLPTDVVNQILEISAHHSPQDLVNARLVHPRYRHEYNEKQAEFSYQIQLEKLYRSWNGKPELHLERFTHPVDDLIELETLHRRVEVKRHQPIFPVMIIGSDVRYSEGATCVSAGGHLTTTTSYSFNDHKLQYGFLQLSDRFVFRMTLLSLDNAILLDEERILPCAIGDVAGLRLVYVFHHPKVEHLMNEIDQGNEDIGKEIRACAMIYQVRGRTFQGICGGAGYRRPTPAHPAIDANQ